MLHCHVILSLLTLCVLTYVVNCYFAMAEAQDPPKLLDENYYRLLSVGLNASSDEIKKKYRALARDYHPDKSSNPLAGEIMSKINRAYSVLMDKAKREAYDEKLADDDEAVDDLE